MNILKRSLILVLLPAVILDIALLPLTWFWGFAIYYMITGKNLYKVIRNYKSVNNLKVFLFLNRSVDTCDFDLNIIGDAMVLSTIIRKVAGLVVEEN